MNKEILEKITSLKPVLKEKFGIEEFAIFGSAARGEASEESDVDIVILKCKKKDYFSRVNAIYFLENELNKKIDMIYFETMRPFIRESVKQDFIYV